MAGVLTQGKQVLRAPKVVLAPGLLPPPPRCPTLSRCVCITQESLEEGMESVLLVLPPNAYGTRPKNPEIYSTQNSLKSMYQ